MADKKVANKRDEGTEGQITLPDTAINPWRIKAPEGQMIAVMKGNKNGELERIIASVSGWHFKYQEPRFDKEGTDKWEWWELVPDEGSPYTAPTKIEQGLLEAEFGIIVVGFGKALYVPHLRHVKWELNPDTNRVEQVSKDYKDPHFFFQQTMLIPVLEVESKGTFKTTIRMNIVFRLVNPYKALFLSGGWEGLVDAAIHSAIRDLISDKTIQEIQNLKEKGGLVDRIKELNEDVDGFKDKFGILIHDVRFVGFDFVGSEKVQNALEAEEVNRLNAEAAKHKADEIRTIGQATAEAARVNTEAYGSGEAAAAVRAAELLKEAVENNKAASVLSINSGNMPIAVTPPEKK